MPNLKHHNKKNLLVFIIPPLRLKCINYTGDKHVSYTLKLYTKVTERRLKQETHDFREINHGKLYSLTRLMERRQRNQNPYKTEYLDRFYRRL